MDVSKQSVTAGDGSHLTQAGGDIYNVTTYVGVTEQRAHEIVAASLSTLRDQFAQEANTKIEERFKQFEDALVERLEGDDTLDKLADPSFLHAVKNAQIGAASVDEKSDRELLAELLAKRAKDDTRAVRAAVDASVRVIDLVDDYALLLLEHLYVFMLFRATSGDTATGLATLDNLHRLLGPCDAPTTNEWALHLDQLGLIRVSGPNPEGARPNFIEMLGRSYQGYFTDGASAIELDRATAVLREIDERLLNLVVPQPFKRPLSGMDPYGDQARWRLACLDIDDLGNQFPSLTSTELDRISHPWGLFKGFAWVPPGLFDVIRAAMPQLDALWEYEKVWNQNLQYDYHFTPAGQALAQASISRRAEMPFNSLASDLRTRPSA